MLSIPTTTTAEEQAQTAYHVYDQLKQVLPRLRSIAALAETAGDGQAVPLSSLALQPGYWLNQHYLYIGYQLSGQIFKLLRIETDPTAGSGVRVAERTASLSALLERVIDGVEGLDISDVHRLDELVDEFFHALRPAGDEVKK